MTNTLGRLSNETVVRVGRRVTQPVTTTASIAYKYLCGKPRGLLPVTAYMSFFLVLPLLFFYYDYDFDDDTTRICTVALSGLLAATVVYANCCCAWYNMALAFHTAIEVKVVDTCLHWAMDNHGDVPDEEYGLAIASAVVIIVHLIPFFVVDRVGILTLLAFVGVLVNASVTVVLDPDFLLIATASSTALLMTTMLLVGACDYGTSYLGLVIKAYRKQEILVLEPWRL